MQARFEPFSSLQVELPSPTSIFVDIVLVFSNRSQVPLKAQVEVPKNATMRQVLIAVQLLEIQTGGPESRLLTCDELIAVEVTRSNVRVVHDLGMQATQAQTSLYLYQLERLEPEEQSVFQMGRLPPGTVPALDDDPEISGADAEGVDETLCSSTVLTVVHRKLKEHQRYWIESTYPVLFGVPALLRVKPGMSAEELYWLVWKQCMHMCPEYDPLDPEAPWPFVLARTNRSGNQWGHWLEGSTGELIPPDNQLLPKFDSDLETIAIDWDMEVYTGFYNDRTTGRFEV